MLKLVALVCVVAMLDCFGSGAFALDTGRLQPEIARITRSAAGDIGIGVVDLKSRQEFYFNGDASFMLQSVSKVPIAIAFLKEVDRNKFRLDTELSLTKEDVLRIRTAGLPDTLPISAKSCAAANLIRKAICKSNNGAADVLTRTLGGPAAVQNALVKSGLKGLRVDRYQHDIIQPGADKPDLDTGTVRAVCNLLVQLADGKLLTPTSTRFLIKTMEETVTGTHRLKAGFPKTYSVAHKTGTGRTVRGASVAQNDVGIVTKPDGTRLVVCVFLSKVKGTEESRDKLISNIAATVARCW